MPLWGKTDDVAGAPKYLNADDLTKTYFVDTTEAAVPSNIAKNMNKPGWVRYTQYVDALGNTRRKSETLVCMKVAPGAAGDSGMTANTTNEDAVVADS